MSTQSKQHSQSKPSYQYPLTSSFNELVQKHSDIGKDKAAYIETKELSSVASTELKSNLSFVSMSKSRVLNLTGDLIYDAMLAVSLVKVNDLRLTYPGLARHRKALPALPCNSHSDQRNRPG